MRMNGCASERLSLRVRSGALAAVVIIIASLFYFALPIPTTAQSSQLQQTAIRTNAQLDKDESAYYHALTQQIERQRSDWWFQHSSLFSGLGPFAALLAVVASLVALVVNGFAARRSRTDVEFVEALKRFGDMTSAPARASAAMVMAHLACKRAFLGLSDDLVTTAYHESTTAQLCSGIVLEQDTKVVDAVGLALQRVRRADATEVDKRITDVESELANELGRTAAGFASHISTWTQRLKDMGDDDSFNRYLLLMNAAGNFARNPSSSIMLWTGERIEDVDRMFGSRFRLIDARLWAEIMMREGMRHAPRPLYESEIEDIKVRMRLLVHKMHVCEVVRA